jgi:beta-glucosidase
MRAGDSVTVTVPVTVSGDRAATVVVQGYVAPVAPPVDREPKALRAWTKAVVPAGTTAELTLTFDSPAFRRWDATEGCWVIDPGAYDLVVAASAGDIRSVTRVEITD